MKTNPKLVISNYFDSVTREVDIYVEETSAKFPKQDVKGLELDQVREQMITEIKLAEAETFKFYESIQQNIMNFTANHSVDDEIDFLASILLASKSIVFLNSSKIFLQVVLEFYLNKNVSRLLKYNLLSV